MTTKLKDPRKMLQNDILGDTNTVQMMHRYMTFKSSHFERKPYNAAYTQHLIPYHTMYHTTYHNMMLTYNKAYSKCMMMNSDNSKKHMLPHE